MRTNNVIRPTPLWKPEFRGSTEVRWEGGRAHQKFVNTAKSVICTPDPGQESPDALIGVSSFFNFFFYVLDKT